MQHPGQAVQLPGQRPVRVCHRERGQHLLPYLVPAHQPLSNQQPAGCEAEEGCSSPPRALTLCEWTPTSLRPLSIHSTLVIRAVSGGVGPFRGEKRLGWGSGQASKCGCPPRYLFPPLPSQLTHVFAPAATSSPAGLPGMKDSYSPPPHSHIQPMPHTTGGGRGALGA